MISKDKKKSVGFIVTDGVSYEKKVRNVVSVNSLLSPKLQLFTLIEFGTLKTLVSFTF